MKIKILFIWSCLVVACISCQEKEIETFKGGHELFFHKFYTNAMYPGTESADSTLTSFFFYPDGTKDIQVPLVVLLSGKLPESDLQFQLNVIEEESTAKPEEYTIDPHYVFRAGKVGADDQDVRDTIMIKLHYSERLKNLPEGLKLVLEIVPNEQVKWGQLERIRAKIVYSSGAVKPEWWTNTIATSLFGVYTEKKFKLFLNEIDKNAEVNGSFIRNRPDLVIKMVLDFKAWLTNQNPPILEEDGSLMQVAI